LPVSPLDGQSDESVSGERSYLKVPPISASISTPNTPVPFSIASRDTIPRDGPYSMRYLRETSPEGPAPTTRTSEVSGKAAMCGGGTSGNARCLWQR
jgi:hypothetical protein